MIELTPKLDVENSKPIYFQLYEYIKNEIITGVLKANTKLPSKRNLSKSLQVSINTVAGAYSQLHAEGYIRMEERSGAFVEKIDSHITIKVSKSLEEVNVSPKVNFKFDFNSGYLDYESFPHKVWKRLLLEAFDYDRFLFQVGSPQGECCLREEICKYLFQSRGVKSNKKNIIIGSGTQFMMMLLTFILGKDKVYGLENPGYHRIRYVFNDLNLKYLPVEVDENGLKIEDVLNTNINVLYLTPSHQFPLGMVMPIRRRYEVLKWADSTDSYIIEDDYDSEFRHIGKPIPALSGLGNSDRVIYLGTFSKSLIPSIRMNYLILPDKLMDIYREKFMIYKRTVPRLEQYCLYLFMKEGHWERHINKMRTLYKRKQQKFMDEIYRYMNNYTRIIGDGSGLHIVLEINNGMTEDELVNSAMDNGLKVYPLSSFYIDNRKHQRPRILLGFGGIDEENISDSIRLLDSAWIKNVH